MKHIRKVISDISDIHTVSEFYEKLVEIVNEIDLAKNEGRIYDLKVEVDNTVHSADIMIKEHQDQTFTLFKLELKASPKK